MRGISAVISARMFPLGAANFEPRFRAPTCNPPPPDVKLFLLVLELVKLMSAKSIGVRIPRSPHVQYTCNESSNSEFLAFCASFIVCKLFRISRNRQSESLSLRHVVLCYSFYLVYVSICPHFRAIATNIATNFDTRVSRLPPKCHPRLGLFSDRILEGPFLGIHRFIRGTLDGQTSQNLTLRR